MGWLKNRRVRKKLIKELNLYIEALFERTDSSVFHQHVKSLQSLLLQLGVSFDVDAKVEEMKRARTSEKQG